MLKTQIRKFVLGWVINALAMYFASLYLNQFNYDSIEILLMVSGIFSLIAIVLKPVVKVLSLPLFFLGPILFFFVDAAVLYGIGMFVPGFHPGDILTVLFAGGIVGLVNYFAHFII
ncbi:MAG: phage holin family protein [Patescibacteria group bacterium]